jgi:hypothetical protein
MHVQKLTTNRFAEAPTNPVLPPPMPSSAALRSPEQIRQTVTRAAIKDHVPITGDGTFLGEDWATEGDWIGRYGREYAVLCAADSPLNHYLVLDNRITVRGTLGLHIRGSDGLRSWCHWETSDDGRVLWDPMVGHRRQAEWDNHGEAYSMEQEGPDIWIEVGIPVGSHEVSLYFFNKDGHDGANRFRDYLLELRRWAADYDQVMKSKPLAVTRVHQFRGGVYERFALAGPSKFFFRLSRHFSFNTICSAVFVDRISGPPGPNEAMALPSMGNLRYDPPTVLAGESLAAPFATLMNFGNFSTIDREPQLLIYPPKGGYCKNIGNTWHSGPGTYSIGIHTQFYLLPKDVSFHFIEFEEGNCTATTTGWFSINTTFSGAVHNAAAQGWVWTPVGIGNIDTGCPVAYNTASFDYAYASDTRAVGPPPQPAASVCGRNFRLAYPVALLSGRNNLDAFHHRGSQYDCKCRRPRDDLQGRGQRRER